jgi:hypothetical protein
MRGSRGRVLCLAGDEPPRSLHLLRAPQHQPRRAPCWTRRSPGASPGVGSAAQWRAAPASPAVTASESGHRTTRGRPRTGARPRRARTSRTAYSKSSTTPIVTKTRPKVRSTTRSDVARPTRERQGRAISPPRHKGVGDQDQGGAGQRNISDHRRISLHGREAGWLRAQPGGVTMARLSSRRVEPKRAATSMRCSPPTTVAGSSVAALTRAA